MVKKNVYAKYRNNVFGSVQCEDCANFKLNSLFKRGGKSKQYDKHKFSLASSYLY